MLRKKKVDVKVTASSGPYPDPLPEHLRITYYFELDDGTVFRDEVELPRSFSDPDRAAGNLLVAQKIGHCGYHDNEAHVFYPPHRIKRVAWRAANVPS